MKALDFAAVCKWYVLLESAGGSKGIGAVTQHCNEIIHCCNKIENCNSLCYHILLDYFTELEAVEDLTHMTQ